MNDKDWPKSVVSILFFLFFQDSNYTIKKYKLSLQFIWMSHPKKGRLDIYFFWTEITVSGDEFNNISSHTSNEFVRIKPNKKRIFSLIIIIVITKPDKTFFVTLQKKKFSLIKFSQFIIILKKVFDPYNFFRSYFHFHCTFF